MEVQVLSSPPKGDNNGSSLFKTLEYVASASTKDGKVGSTVKHLVRTAYWVRYLKPDADEALLLAAVSHDIERASRHDHMLRTLNTSADGFMDKEFLEKHQRIGAKMMADFLSEQE